MFPRFRTISAYLRRTVRTLYAFACGYCGLTETELGTHLTIDHFMPQDAGGTDEIENLVLMEYEARRLEHDKQVEQGTRKKIRKIRRKKKQQP